MYRTYSLNDVVVEVTTGPHNLLIAWNALLEQLKSLCDGT